MKYIAAGDIHGNLFFANCLVERIKELLPEKVVLLGDIYGNSYSAEMDELLLSAGVEIESVEGNCDYRHAALSHLNFAVGCIMEYAGSRRFLFTHGHIYNRYNLPSYMKKGDVFIYGHTHNNNIAIEKDVHVVNAGSVSAPRGASKNSFVFIDGKSIEIREVENGNLIKRLQLE
jgi:putative phosphoesterase